MSDQYEFETLAIRTQAEKSKFNEHSVPLYLTSSFVFEDAETMRAMFAKEKEGNIYSRYSNPNVDELLQKICLLEQADAAWATASGMSAIFTTFAALLASGDHIVSSKSVFGSTHLVYQNFEKWGITHDYADINNFETWEKAIQPNTKVLYVETPANPSLDIIDLEKLGNLAKQYGLILIVDNCFATPYLQQPLKWGANLVIHSATKYLDGQGRILGGIIAGEENLIEPIQSFARFSGPAMSAFNAWILSKSIETLAIRMDRHCENALALAEYLEGNTKVNRTIYPFLTSHPKHNIAKKQMLKGGGIVAFEIKGGLKAGRNFIDNIKLCSITANLGDSRTIITHPASTTHAKLSEKERLSVGITDGFIRISTGLENIKDIIADIEQALN